MSRLEQNIPDWLLKRSLVFKSFVIVLGAVLLLLSTFIRSNYPVVWILVFLSGALIEWVIVATVYVEMEQLQQEIKQSESMIRGIEENIQDIQSEVEATKEDIDSTKRDTFSNMSNSQGAAGHRSIEDRLEDLENEVGTGRTRRGSLRQRVSELEQKIG